LRVHGFVLGSAGCQPAVAGSLPATFGEAQTDSTSRFARFVSASCRDVQAGSLRSPELNPAALILNSRLPA
jgi:hypothetical protein